MLHYLLKLQCLASVSFNAASPTESIILASSGDTFTRRWVGSFGEMQFHFHRFEVFCWNDSSNNPINQLIGGNAVILIKLRHQCYPEDWQIFHGWALELGEYFEQRSQAFFVLVVPCRRGSIVFEVLPDSRH